MTGLSYIGYLLAGYVVIYTFCWGKREKSFYYIFLLCISFYFVNIYSLLTTSPRPYMNNNVSY
jgi:hypothetical protein